MADKKMINAVATSNPDLLCDLLRGMDLEIDGLRVIVNELATDHDSTVTTVSNVISVMNGMGSTASSIFHEL